MAKKVDDNGFWLIEGNPVSKEGVFPYLGKSISPALDAEKIYNVYRPFSELANPDTLKSFDGIPFIEDHEMLGTGFTPTDRRTPQGILMNPRAESGMIVGDLKIFSDALKNSISSGKKELSLGYKCNYRLERGMWNGHPYDAIQTNVRGNHIALVERGRMGSDVKVYDCACDALDIEKEIISHKKEKEMENDPVKKDTPQPEATAKDEKVDKRKLIDEIGGILKDKVSDEIIRTIIKKAEEIAYNESEAGTANDAEEGEEAKPEEKKDKNTAQDKCGRDEFYDGPHMERLIKRLMENGDISEDVAKKLYSSLKYSRKEEGASTGMDAADVVVMFDRRAALYNRASKFTGDFAMDGMTDVEVARVIAKKIGVSGKNDSEVMAAVNGYLSAMEKHSREYSIAADSAPRRINSGMSDKIKDYLAGK